MRIIYLLHFYQPDFQFKQVLEDVYTKSYTPIFNAIERTPNAKIVINITASTIEMFNNYSVGTLIKDLKRLYNKGKIEFTATSMAHVLLSHASEEQALRQIDLDLGKKAWYLDVPRENFKVLFPPELSFNDQLLKVIKKSELNSMVVPHSIFKNFDEENNKLKKQNINIFVRSLKLSRIFESPEVVTLNKLDELINKYEFKDDKTYLIAHDAEILGYQNESKLDFFKEVLNSSKFELTTFSEELEKNDFEKLSSKLYPGTWEKLLIDNEWVDIHWKNPKNQIHKFQWKLSEIVIKNIEKFPEINIKFELQTHLDYCQYSCQYWWASSYPFWSSGIISHAAWTWLYLAYRVYFELMKISKPRAISFIAKVEKYYMNIIKHLAQYDLSKWHEKNISYYDNFIHPLKLKYEL